MNTTQKTKGFTIIEVVLVLAIAGLIFLIVFLALPALQRQQRDTQRRSDASRVLTAIQNYQSNNTGKVPSTQANVTTLLNSYVKPGTTTFDDPSGTAYVLTWKSGADATVPDDPAVAGSQFNVVWVYSSAKCSGEATVAGTTNQAAVRVALENGGVFCSSNAN